MQIDVPTPVAVLTMLSLLRCPSAILSILSILSMAAKLGLYYPLSGTRIILLPRCPIGRVVADI
eukprot:scaffold81290_cov59-Phaeocystis_antarctica.AAC.10